MTKVAQLKAVFETAQNLCRCSFCGSSESDVAVLVMSEDRRVGICDRCLRTAASAAFEHLAERALRGKGGRS